MNRRDLLKGAAIALLAMLPISSVIAADRSDWNKAVADFKQAQLVCDRAGKAHTAAEQAVEQACPRPSPAHFNRYRLSCVASHETNVENAHKSVMMLGVIEGGKLPSSYYIEGPNCEAKKARAEAERIADELEAWLRNSREADKRFRTKELEEQWEASLDRREKARADLIALPAPDNDALLFKIELLNSSLDEMDDHDAPSMAAIASDARRLLSHGRA